MAKLESNFTNECKILFEHSIAINGCSYLVIFGKHINGGFICVPNWGWGCEATTNSYSVEYNTEKLMKCGAPKDVAREIALYIENQVISTN